MPDNFLVIRIHPDSPVDAATFSTYLEDLQIEVYLAGTFGVKPPIPPIGQTNINSASLTLIEDPFSPGTYIASVSKLASLPTQRSGGAFGTTLAVEDADGVPFGAIATSADPKMFNSGTTVTNIPAPAAGSTALTLSQAIQNFTAQGNVVTFAQGYGPQRSDSNAPATVNADLTSSNPTFSFQLKVKGKVTSSTTVKFDHTDGIAVKMIMTGPGVPANTTVVAVPDGSTITLNNAVSLANGATVKFQLNLNSGIVQHVEPFGVNTIFFGELYVPIPASVATAIIPLTMTLPESAEQQLPGCYRHRNAP